MDILQAAANSKKYTLHAHTQFCDGRATMQEFIDEAERQGFDLYGFTPHSPIPFDSPCNMSINDVEPYLAEVKRLQALHPGIKILAGMEIDYIDDRWCAASPLFQEMPLDFRLSSIHFIPSQDGQYVDIDGRYENFKTKMADHFHGDLRYVVDTFFDQSQRMIAAGGFDIIGHFDKVKHNAGLFHPGLEDEPWYASQVNDLIDSIIASGVIVEINTKAWEQHQQLFPAQRHWRRLLQAGVPIVISSDAHYPRLINASRDAAASALEYLRKKLNNHN